MSQNESIIVLYHDPCSDGFLSRLIAEYYYRSNPPANGVKRSVVYVGVNPSTLAADLQRCLTDDATEENACADATQTGRKAQTKRFAKIRMFDVSLTMAHYAQLCAASDDVLVFDHHESTQKALFSAKKAESGENKDKEEKESTHKWLTFDNAHCGAHLAWQHYFGSDYPIPDIVKFVEIRDLWLFGTPRDISLSKEITTYLYDRIFAIPFSSDFSKYAFLFDAKETLAEFWRNAAQEGGDILRRVDEQVDAKIAKMSRKTISSATDGKNLVALVGESDVYASEIGSKVMKTMRDIDCVLVWTFDAEQRIRISLRSDAQHCNVNALANRLWGGGGHAAAAGALIADEQKKLDFLDRFSTREKLPSTE